MKYTLTHSDYTVNTTVKLPSSKSITNRLLIIRALCRQSFAIHNLSDSDDSAVLQAAFTKLSGQTIDIGHAGTSMRFLTAYLATLEGEHLITGSARMQQRPIAILVDALRELGAYIEYAGQEGFPPLRIKGGSINRNRVEIDGGVSSQFISALLMIAPTLPNGLYLHLKNEIISRPYIGITLSLMQYFGVSHQWEQNTLYIPPQTYQPRDITVEPDWSGASYWYQIAALSKEAHITISDLSAQSLQGDSRCAQLFSELGVHSEFSEQGVVLSKTSEKTSFFEHDFNDIPDLAQTFVVTLCMLNIPFRITGLRTLRIKETDRLTALQTELKKMGFTIEEPTYGILSWNGKKQAPLAYPCIDTYHDHRMAMAFAPAILKYPGHLTIEDPMVVSKSYPQFWSHLQQAGFDFTIS